MKAMPFVKKTSKSLQCLSNIDCVFYHKRLMVRVEKVERGRHWLEIRAFGTKSLGLSMASFPLIIPALVGKATRFPPVPPLGVAAWGSGLRRIPGFPLGSAGRSAGVDEQCPPWTWGGHVVAGTPRCYRPQVSAGGAVETAGERPKAKMAVLHMRLKEGAFGVLSGSPHCSVLSGKRNVIWKNISKPFCKTKTALRFGRDQK